MRCVGLVATRAEGLLDVITKVFSVPTGRFISYQVKDVVPYWINRYVARNKAAKLAPLLMSDGARDITVAHGSRMLDEESKQ